MLRKLPLKKRKIIFTILVSVSSFFVLLIWVSALPASLRGLDANEGKKETANAVPSPQEVIGANVKELWDSITNQVSGVTQSQGAQGLPRVALPQEEPVRLYHLP